MPLRATRNKMESYDRPPPGLMWQTRTMYKVLQLERRSLRRRKKEFIYLFFEVQHIKTNFSRWYYTGRNLKGNQQINRYNLQIHILKANKKLTMHLNTVGQRTWIINKKRRGKAGLEKKRFGPKSALYFEVNTIKDIKKFD